MENFDLNRSTQQYAENIRESNRLISQALNIIQESNRELAHFINIGILNNRISSTRALTGRVRNLRTDLESTQNIDFDRLTPVVVAPSRLQIFTSTRLKVYGDIENPTTNICPITQEPFSDHDVVLQIIHCGHLFNRDALRQWFSSSVHCPLCRHDIRNTENDST